MKPSVNRKLLDFGYSPCEDIYIKDIIAYCELKKIDPKETKIVFVSDGPHDGNPGVYLVKNNDLSKQ